MVLAGHCQECDTVEGKGLPQGEGLEGCHGRGLLLSVSMFQSGLKLSSLCELGSGWAVKRLSEGGNLSAGAGIEIGPERAVPLFP